MGNVGVSCCCTDPNANTSHEHANKDTAQQSLEPAMVFRPRNKTVKEVYDIDPQPVGRGSFGVVHRARDNATQCSRAIKSIAKAKVKNHKKLQSEVMLMKAMDHPHIIKLFDTYEDPVYLFVVMELCDGGELFELIARLDEFTEREASFSVEQILQAVYYMHSKHFVCHRDLKPENFLWVTHAAIKDNSLKLIDFGLSTKCGPGESLQSRSGTALYVAPEILHADKTYKHEVDLWSVGVIMYCMLCGYPPFTGRNDQAVMKKVKQGSFSFASAEWHDVSEDAKNLIRSLLKMNVSERLTAEQALAVPWIKMHAPKEIAGHHLSTNVGKNLTEFRGTGMFKKAALQCVATQLDSNKIKELGDAFKRLDVNNDGVLSPKELEGALKTVGEDLLKLFKELDFDGSGSIDYTEFIAASLDRREQTNRELCWKAFRMFDVNGDGTISNDEVPHIFEDKGIRDRLGADAIKAMMDEVDKNNDGQIDFEEFMAMMQCHGLN